MAQLTSYKLGVEGDSNLASLMIKNGLVVTMDESDRLLTDGALYIEGSRIIDIGKTEVLEKHTKRMK